MALTLLQLAAKFASLAYLPAVTKLYQRTLDWFPGFVFMLSSVLTVVAMIPVRCVSVHLGLLQRRCLWLNTGRRSTVSSLTPASLPGSIIGCRLPEKDGRCRRERGHSLPSAELAAVWDRREPSQKVRN